jgi:RHS repeat-associated protein
MISHSCPNSGLVAFSSCSKNINYIYQSVAANWAYHHHDALGSLRQLTDSEGTVTLTKSYLPYGDELSSSGVSTSSYGFTGEMQDMATGLVYLRARYYAPWDGRFLTQDPWDGDYNQPMSYNGWLYGYANPVMFADSSGQNPLSRYDKVATLDITAWLQSEMLKHYTYGTARRSDVRLMKLITLSWPYSNSGCGDPIPELDDIATMHPYNVIVDEFTMFGGIPIGHFPATTEATGFPLVLAGLPGLLLAKMNTVNFLAGVEYGAYGLAIDYATIGYSPQPNTIEDAGNGDDKKVVTICGKAHDVSDVGNIMFGLGGQARGYPLEMVYLSAASFNGLSGEGIISALGPDGWGAPAGWWLGLRGAYTSEASMCNQLDNLDFLGYRDNAEQLASWLPSDEAGVGIVKSDISSLVRLSGTSQYNSRSTLAELTIKLSNRFSHLFP